MKQSKTYFFSDYKLRQQLEFCRYFENVQALLLCTMLFPCFSDTHASGLLRGAAHSRAQGSDGLVRHRHVNMSVLVSGPTLLSKLFFHNLFFVFRNKMEVVRRLKCLHVCSCVDPDGACAPVLRSVVLRDGGAIVCDPSRGFYPSSNVCSALGHLVPPTST